MVKVARGRVALGAAWVLLLVVLAPVVALGAAGDFSQPSTSPESAGNTGLGIVSADFNGDGKADLAVANQGSNDVTILLGDGTGNFTAAAGSPEAATSPSDIAAADLDDDDDVDLVTASSPVSILLNDGMGDFAPALTEALGDQPRSIDIADMNGDTDPDLVVGQFFQPKVTVMLSDGMDTGNFTALAAEDASESGPGGDNVADVTAANIDNDSDVDVMVARAFTGTAHTMSNANGLGDLAFVGPQITGVGAVDTVLGQFGSNAFNDLAIANSANNTIAILIGQGDGSFTPAATSPEAVPPAGPGQGPNELVAADLNGDGNLDLAAAAGFSGPQSRVAVLMGNGAGDFTPTAGSPIDVGANIPASIAAGQFDGGGLDLAVSNFFPLPNSAVNILLNDAPAIPANPGGGGGPPPNPIGPMTPVPVTTPPRKCKKGFAKKKGKCVKKKAKKKKK